jgi:O-antigen ligase
LSAIAHELPQAAVNRKLIDLIATGALAIGVMLSGFVINEPAPYDIYMVALVAIWALFGLRISRTIAPLFVLLALFNIGGLISMSQLPRLDEIPLYLAVTGFLSLTAVFFAAATEADDRRYRTIFHAWVLAAVMTASLGIAGYFQLFPGAERFTRYSRATGSFQDPNVFGPFLVLPACYLYYRMLTGGPRAWAACVLPLTIIALGIFLSFSRGAWGLFGFSVVALTFLLFLRSDSGLFRLRVGLMSMAALAVLVLVLLVALQLPAVQELFTARAQLTQDYDTARVGRFARYLIGLEMAIEHPLGIGPLEFGKLVGADTHNIWLKAILDYSWLGFIAWVTMVAWTLGAGLRILLRDRPWQPYLLIAWVVFAGHVALGNIIDTDHWRHFFILIGLVWAGIALEARWQRLGASRS